MVVHYPFDGNTSDYGPNGIKLNVYGDPQPTKDRFGNLNSAFYFDGEKDVMIGDAAYSQQITSHSLFRYGLIVMMLERVMIMQDNYLDLVVLLST